MYLHIRYVMQLNFMLYNSKQYARHTHTHTAQCTQTRPTVWARVRFLLYCTLTESDCRFGGTRRLIAPFTEVMHSRRQTHFSRNSTSSDRRLALAHTVQLLNIADNVSY